MGSTNEHNSRKDHKKNKERKSRRERYDEYRRREQEFVYPSDQRNLTDAPDSTSDYGGGDYSMDRFYPPLFEGPSTSAAAAAMRLAARKEYEESYEMYKARKNHEKKLKHQRKGRRGDGEESTHHQNESAVVDPAEKNKEPPEQREPSMPVQLKGNPKSGTESASDVDVDTIDDGTDFYDEQYEARRKTFYRATICPVRQNVIRFTNLTAQKIPYQHPDENPIVLQKDVDFLFHSPELPGSQQALQGSPAESLPENMEISTPDGSIAGSLTPEFVRSPITESSFSD